MANTPGDGIERRFEPPIPLLAFPMEPGKTWQGRYKNTRSDGSVSISTVVKV